MTNFISYENAKADQTEIISDYFDDEFGRWQNYATLDSAQRTDLLNQKHNDLRAFTLPDYKNSFLIDLFDKSMSDLNGIEVSLINAPILIEEPETWTGLQSYSTTDTSTIVSNIATLTVGSGHGIIANDRIKVSGLSNIFNGYYAVISVNETTISYAIDSIDQTSSATGTVELIFGNESSWRALKIKCAADVAKISYSQREPIDINQYENDGFITIALPNLPQNLDNENCSVTLTTDTSSSGFDVDVSDTITFENNLYGLDGHAEFKFPTFELVNVFSNHPEKGKISKIKFSITSTEDDWFYCTGIRCVSANWKYAPMDINTIEKAVVKSVPRSGALPRSYLVGDITDLSSSIDILDADEFPTTEDGGGVLLVSRSEYISYTTKIGNQLSGLTRGVYDSTPKNHTDGADVTLYDFNFAVNTIGSRLPSYWPVLYKSFDPNGNVNDEDPKIIDGSVYAVIDMGNTFDTYSSSLEQNQFCFYFRNTSRFPTQNELNYYSQTDLNSLATSPVDIIPEYLNKTQQDLSKVPGTKAGLTLPSWGGNKSYQVGSDDPVNSFIGNKQVNISKIPGAYAESTLPVWGISESYQVNDVVPSATPTNGETQESLQRVLNTSNIAYTSVNFRWYKSDIDLKLEIKIGDEIADMFTFNTVLDLEYMKNKTLVFGATVESDTIECKIFELKDNKLNLVYNTGTIESEFFHHVRGRFGWTGILTDGTSRIRSIRSGAMVYGEQKTTVMNSFTPVKGGQIFSSQSDEKELITELMSNPWSVGTDSVNAEIDNTDPKNPVEVYTISDPNTKIWQGIATNEFKITTFKNFYIKLDVKYPSTANQLLAFLYDEKNNALMPLNVPPFTYDQWTTIRLLFNDDQILPGFYKLLLVENGYNNSNPWKVKNVFARERSVQWDIRSFVDGPWDQNNRDWVSNPLVSTISENKFTNGHNANDGVVLAKSDVEFQVRAYALNQYVELEKFDAIPKYATLGNPVWRNG
jgi:hypothetical protein